MQLKLIFIQKEVPALVFYWQLSEFFNNNLFKERKKALPQEKKHYYEKKKHCSKKRGSDIYRKYNYATFYVTSRRFRYFSTVHSDNRLHLILSVEKNHWK